MIYIKKAFNNLNQIKMGAALSYFAIAFNIVAGLIYTPWMVHQIGQSDYGLYTLAGSLIGFFAMDFGLGSAVSRFMSKYQAEGDEQKANDFLGIVFKLYLIIDLILFVVLFVVFLFLENIYGKLTVDELAKLRIIFFIAGLFSLISFPFAPLNGILISNEKFVLLKFCDLIKKLLTIIFMVVALIMGFRLYALVIVNAFVGIIAIAMQLYYVKSKTKTVINFRCKNHAMLKSIFSFSIWTTVIAIALRFVINISPTILGAFSGTSQIAVFAVGTTIEAYTWTFANALNGLFLPKVSRLMINNDKDQVEKLMIRVGRIQLIIIGLIYVGFLSMGKEFIVLWMGSNYSVAYYVALLLITPSIVTLTQEIAYTMLVAINEIKYRAIASVMAAVCSILISVTLAPKFGAIGVGFGICIGTILGSVIGMNIVYSKVLKIDIMTFFKECHLKMILPLALTLILALLLQWLLPVSRMFLFIIKAGFIGIIYLVLLWLLGLNTFEKDLFLSAFKNFRKRKA